ncbi:hypothetical protein VTJ04DRAFT_10288 [Mycothermus thermophilus]|uniref:uncharacterized protein n=1 Tax=Humicola insolens TaxID=85995 RepID=UPI0037423975
MAPTKYNPKTILSIEDTDRPGKRSKKTGAECLVKIGSASACDSGLLAFLARHSHPLTPLKSRLLFAGPEPKTCKSGKMSLMPQEFQDQNKTNAMLYTHGDLPILSAETYGGIDASIVNLASTSSKRADPASKKRVRTQAGSTPEPQEEKKRARGRPRLETKDETAAERRRTQIRLAQRAYRDRKEQTIQNLENKVKTLASANEEMSNAFMQLHDFALRSGLLDRFPEFGRQLRQTTEKFLSLAREASDDDASADPRPTSSEQHSSTSSTSRPTAPGTSAARSPSNPVTETSGSLSGDPAPGTTPELDSSIPTLADDPLNPDSNPLCPFTYDNPASCAVSTSGATPFSLCSNSSSAPAFTYPSATIAPPPLTPSSISVPNPYLSLPPPLTFATLESTFGRRLQRFALERALDLLTMPSPPRHWIKRVFGFSLMLETPEAIVQRLRRVLANDSRWSLNYWGVPFYNLGGAGTHFTSRSSPAKRRFLVISRTRNPSLPVTDTHASDYANRSHNHHRHQQQRRQQHIHAPLPTGNTGLLDFDKPATTAGFAQGPFTPSISAIRDEALSDDMRMLLPGFAGEYFDCDEVELYLFQRGVVIPPGTDVVCVEVEVGDLERFRRLMRALREMREQQHGKGGGSAVAAAAVVGQFGGLEWRVRTVDQFGNEGAIVGEDQAGLRGGSGSAMGEKLVDPALMADGGMLPFGLVMSTPLQQGVAGQTGNPMGVAGQRQGEKRTARVTLDVMTLVKKLTTRAICLGRTPGFKQIDLDTAFWASVEAGMEAEGLL